MKLHENLKCPYCNGSNVYCYLIDEVKIWDESVHDDSFKKARYLSEDHIIYKVKCDDCDKHFNVYLQLKNIEPGDIIIDPNDRSFAKKVRERRFDNN